jgi:hypothetical protein
MKFNTLSRFNSEKPTNSDQMLKATSLLYLKEALGKEQYEECAALIQKAIRYGAKQVEIRQILKAHVQKVGSAVNRSNPGSGNQRF